MRFGTVIAVALMAALAGAGQRGAAHHSPGVLPLNDLGGGVYLGQFQGGLYENGANAVPADHAAAGAARAAQVQPLDALGAPAAAGGKIVLLSVGMSNTTQEFCGGAPASCGSYSFVGQALADPQVNHSTLTIVDGAAGGQTAQTWDAPTDANYDRVRDTRLAPLGVTEAQVQAVWVKVADAGPASSLPNANADAYALETYTGGILRALRVRYPNVKLVFLSSRIYAGYATTSLNPEPYAYESGFAARWAIQAQVDQMRGGAIDAQTGDLDYNTVAPWVAWGAYLWADGLTARSDGLTWVQTDFAADGTHPALDGRQKVGAMLLTFFKSSPFTQCWFTVLCSTADGDGDGVIDPIDNCVSNANPGQENADGNFIDLTPPKANDDLTWIRSDAAGNACDSDDDNDGLEDFVEESYTCLGGAMDPLLRDTDGDRRLDGAECAYGSNPANPQSVPAGIACTVPGSPDSDSDGIRDALELCFYNSNYFLKNSDNDVCGDGREVMSMDTNVVVNAADLGLTASAFGTYGTPPAPGQEWRMNMDVDKNGVVNAADLGLVASKFGACP